MDTKEYNGYRNWATWQVVLWFANEEPQYRYVRSHAPFTAAEAEDTARSIYPAGTPDMDSGSDYSDVDWGHVAEAWSEE